MAEPVNGGGGEKVIILTAGKDIIVTGMIGDSGVWGNKTLATLFEVKDPLLVLPIGLLVSG